MIVIKSASPERVRFLWAAGMERWKGRRAMTSWDELFRDDRHILRQPDVFAIEFARILRDQGARSVLDWGCGAGRHVVFLAHQGFQVTGMDPAPSGIERARKWLEAEGLQAALQVAPPGRIPARSRSFDAALSLYAIEHGRRKEVLESVRELHRVLRSGGWLLVARSSGEDSMKHHGRPVAPGTYVPLEGPEAGVPHYLTTREDIDEFFAPFEVFELAHVCSWLSGLYGERRMEAHWVVIGRKPEAT